MSAVVRRCRTRDGVPLDRDAFVVEGKRSGDQTAITITYRQVEGVARGSDRVVFERSSADGYAALALARDLARLVDCKSVFVIGTDLPTESRSRR